IVMIGCGCLEDLDGILEESGLPGNGGNADDLVIYVFDSHRPIHLSNIYEKQNRVIVIDDDQEGLGDTGIPPEPDDDEEDAEIVLGSERSTGGSPGRRELLTEDNDDEDEHRSETGSDGERAGKRPRGRTGTTPEAKQRRIEIGFQREAMKEVYYYGHYKTTPASIILYRIAAEHQYRGLSNLWAACCCPCRTLRFRVHDRSSSSGDELPSLPADGEKCMIPYTKLV
ncbi:hypothetical protein FOZ62_015317, partial [Perkinsus olseni]